MTTTPAWHWCDRGDFLRAPLIWTFLICFVDAVMFIVSTAYDTEFESLSVNPFVGPPLDALLVMGAKDVPLIVGDGATGGWRLITAVFLHAGIIHLALSVVFKLLAGFLLERRIGWWRVALSVFAVWHGRHVGVGALLARKVDCQWQCATVWPHRWLAGRAVHLWRAVARETAAIRSASGCQQLAAARHWHHAIGGQLCASRRAAVWLLHCDGGAVDDAARCAAEAATRTVCQHWRGARCAGAVCGWICGVVCAAARGRVVRILSHGELRASGRVAVRDVDDVVDASCLTEQQ
jgi:hypothetical protein